ncbi:MAG: ribbon-helix-helix protein, CopG family [Sphingomonadaceae bacterium]|nr:ribbon-helix-helix protein, CopG family [Sphingomonadaceae bacterium]
MSKSVVVTARVTPQIVEALDGLAKRMGRSRASIVAEAIREYAEEQAAFLDFVEEGERDIDEGRCLTREEIEGWLDERIANANALAEAKRAKAA